MKKSSKNKIEQKDVLDGRVKPYIMDPANVTAIVMVGEVSKNVVALLGFKTMRFKKLGDREILMFTGNMSKFKLPDGSTYSYDWFTYAEKLFKLLRNHANFEIYQAWDSNKNKWKKDEPCLFRLDDVGFLIAPRIEQD